MNNSNINYYFTCKESGKHIIPQNWSDFFRLQGDDSFTQKTLYHLEYGHKRSSSIPYKYWKDRNNFWKGAKGYEKIGKVDCSAIPEGTYLDTIRLFLKELINHSAMQGDEETYQKARYNDKFFHSASGSSHNTIHTLLLTE